MLLEGSLPHVEWFSDRSVPPASFRLRLDPSIKFDFVDGAYPSAPAPDIAHFYPGPYYQHWHPGATTTEAILSSHVWLLEKIVRDGPYDGVMLFSQGCSVIGSFLLYHQAARPAAPPPFKVAIFICGGIPLQVLEDLGVEVSKAAYELDQRSKELLETKNEDSAVLQMGRHRWGEPPIARELLDLDAAGAAMLDPRNVFGLDVTGIPPELKIKIPTDPGTQGFQRRCSWRISATPAYGRCSIRVAGMIYQDQNKFPRTSRSLLRGVYIWRAVDDFNFVLVYVHCGVD